MDEGTAQQIRGLAAESPVLEAQVRQAVLGQVQAEGSEVVGAAEIREVAEAFACSHVPMVSRPDDVVKLIETAAERVLVAS
jgi:hypothetical protein